MLSISVGFEHFTESVTAYRFNSGLHVIYGESGVGKSNFARILANVPIKDKTNFSITINNTPDDIYLLGQNPDHHIISPTLFEEMAFNYEAIGLPFHEIQFHIKEMQNYWDFLQSHNRHPATLSGGEKEILSLETGLSLNPQLLLLDDSLSFLDDKTKMKALKRIRDWVVKTKSDVVWFTSDKNDLKFGDTCHELTLSSLVQVEKVLSVEYEERVKSRGKLSWRAHELTISVGDSTLFDGFSIEIDEIRAMGITGRNGSGKSTLARVLVGINKPEAGVMNLTMANKDPLQVGYLDQFPERILGTITLHEFCSKLIFHGKLKTHKYDRIISELETHQINWNILKFCSLPDIPWTLLRFTMVVILINCEYDVLILDEPTFGLGDQQKLTLHRVLRDFLTQKHLVLISHDLEFVHSICDKVFSVDHLKIEQPIGRKQAHQKR